MLYRIKQKFWSFGDSFTIDDAHGNPVLRVQGAAFSWGNNLRVFDNAQREVATIEQELLTLSPRFSISIGGQPFAQVVKEFSWFEKSFTLDVPGPNDYEIKGSFWKHEFTFTRQGRAAARISKQWSWTDSYGVETVDGENDLAILCTCIVIDQVIYDGNN